jgi:hypothetical protein
MSLRLSLVRAFRPRVLMKKSLKDLFSLTAHAFGREAPDLRAMPWAECLRQYAVFTRAEVEKAMAAGPDIEPLRERLRKNAAAFGRLLRARLGIRTAKEALDGLTLLYGAIEIELLADATGGVTIPRCFFSRHYTPAVCHVVSALDEGLAAGFTDGGRLQFSQRITEGHACCRAVLVQGAVLVNEGTL